MKKNYFTLNTYILFACIFFACVSSLSAQVDKPFKQRYTTNLRGELIMLANNIVSKNNGGVNPNEDYTGGEDNNDVSVGYIDIDNDSSTFSSSSSTLSLNDCATVRYAGLYWSGIYPVDVGDGDKGGTPINPNYDKIKFAIPGNQYVDITAEEEYYGNPTGAVQETSYYCYKDVTDIVTALENTNGVYTVANVRATTGRKNGGSGGGWILVMVYEDPNMPGRYISTFDGYAAVNGNGTANTLDFSYSGFKTIPNGNVKARLGIGALEGDYGKSGDAMEIKADGKTNFTALVNDRGQYDNFFNSSITLDGNNVTTRTPKSSNTFGFDADIFQLNNNDNSIIDNDETGLTVRVSTKGDGYGVFLNTMSIDIIQPEIKLTKKVENLAGDDITGAEVDLGQEMYYVLGFQNVGNDNAMEFSLRDALPANVNIIDSDIQVPNEVGEITYNYVPYEDVDKDGVADEGTHTIVFDIPDDYVEIGDKEFFIRLKVKVVKECTEFRNACSNIIQNQAYASYTGDVNKAEITDDPSVKGYNACNIAEAGSTNFIANIADCIGENTIELCGATSNLTAGSGFDTYQWYRQDAGGNWVAITGETNQSYEAPGYGEYKVVKTIPAPCTAFDEFFSVVPRTNNPESPFIDNADEMVTCTNDGTLLPKFYLCGVNDVRSLSATSLSGGIRFVWEKLNDGCSEGQDLDSDCPTRDNSCSWTTLKDVSSTDPNAKTFDIKYDDVNQESAAGEYRLVVYYDGNCFTRYPFKVYQNTLNPTISTQDIICDTQGKIEISGISDSAYKYAISTQDPSTFSPNPCDDSAWQESKVFNVETAGVYHLYITQTGINCEAGDRNPCVFRYDNIEIKAEEFNVDVDVTDPRCYDGFGSIDIDVYNARQPYNYTLTNNKTGSVQQMPSNDPDHTFTNLLPGEYHVKVTTEDGCDFEDDYLIEAPEEMILTAVEQDIACDDGAVTLTVEGGDPIFDYAIYSYTPAATATKSPISPTDPKNYTSENVFTIAPGEEGTYVFLVIDGNDECKVTSNSVTVENKPLIKWDLTKTDLSCFQSGDGVIKVDHGATNGYNLTYVLEKPDGTSVNSSDGEFNNLPAGRNYKVTVTQDYGNQSCSSDKLITLTEPDRLTASAGVSKLPGCNASDEKLAEVRITNPLGGTPPYEYSFDGENTYNTTAIGYLKADTHTLYVRDSKGCKYSMEIEIPDLPEEPTANVDYTYNCDGSGNITVTPNIPDYEYTYDVDGTPVTGDFGDEFTYDNLSSGEHTVTIHYNNPNYVTYSNLLNEDFGRGSNTTSPYIDPKYCYESQYPNDPSDCDPSGNDNREINDGEYSVTSKIDPGKGLFVGWISPNDHTDPTDPHGRYMAINIGGVAGVNGVIFKKRVHDVIPNQDVSVELEAFNLIGAGTQDRDDPFLVIQLVGTDGVVIAETSTDRIPRHTDANTWINYAVELNPGNNDELDIVIRTQNDEVNGNDIAIDDILAYQVPEKCDLTIDVPIIINGEAFSAELSGATSATCNGDNDGSITFKAENFTATDGFEYSTDNTNWSAIQTTSPVTISDLEAGDYTIYVRDARDVNNTACQISFGATVPEPKAITVSADVIQQMTCNNSFTAIIEATAKGGNGNFKYQLESPANNIIVPYQTDTEFTVTGASNAGDYVIRVKDDKDCVSPATASIEVTAPEAIDFDVTTVACYDGENGDITVTVNSGNGDYQFSLDGSNWFSADATTPNQYIFTNRTPDDYTVYVQDGYGCGDDKPIRIEPRLTASVQSQTDISCVGESDGQVTITVNNAQGEYGYTVDGGTGGTGISTNSFTVNPLAPGNHTIEITDAESCTVEVKFTIGQPTAALIISGKEVKNITCNTSGSVTITAEDGWGDYEYSITSNDGTVSAGPQSSNVFNNLSHEDTYTITVTDAGGCEVTDTFTLSTTASPEVTLAATTDLCYDSSNGGVSLTATVTAGTGTPSFSYVLNNTDTGISRTSQSSNVFKNVLPGTYTVTVTDANNCSDTSDASVTIAPELTASAYLDSDLICTVDAQVTITANGGDGNYSYAWDNTETGSFANTTGFTNNVFTTGVAGTYYFQITDGVGCTTTTGPIEINPAEKPEITSVTPTNILCHGSETGALDVQINTLVGLGPFSIEVFKDDGTGTPDLANSLGTQTSNLAAGDYLVVITDAKDCKSDPFAVTISEPDKIDYDIDLNPIQCQDPGGTSPGSITIENLTGGVGEYTYYLSGNNGHKDKYITIANGEDHVFNILDFGIYEIDVVDSNGCSVKTTNIIASPPDDLDIDITTATTDCTSGGTAVVTVSSAVGSGDYEFGILDQLAPPYASIYQDADTGTPETSTFTNLIPGIVYTFVVYDKLTDCYYFESAEGPINTLSEIEVLSLVPSNVTCTGSNNGSVSLTIDKYDSGATSIEYEIFNAQSNITTGHSGSVMVTSPPDVIDITNIGVLPPGTYYVLLKEIGGAYDQCTAGSDQFRITESTNILTVSATSKNDNCNINAGEILATAQYGTPPYSFIFLPNTDPEPVANDTNWASLSKANVETGNYTVYVKDANNCIQDFDISIGLDPSPIISGTIDDLCAKEGKYSATISLDQAGMYPYTLSVNGQPFQNVTFDIFDELQVNNLHSGSGQNIRVKDQNGCISTYNFDIYPPLVPSLEVTAQPICTPGTNGAGNNGEITINASGGSGTYGYAIYHTDGVTAVSGTSVSGNRIVDVPYGDFIVRITDDMNDSDPLTNCSKDVPVRLEAPTPVDFTLSKADVKCNGGTDGAITVELDATNDNPPYSYDLVQIDGFGGAPLTGGITRSQLGNQTVFNNLPAGWYNVTVTSNKGCELERDIEIIQPPLLEIAAAASNSCGNDGTYAVTVTLDPNNLGNVGTAPYKLRVNGALRDVVFDPSTREYVITDLNAGDYSIEIIDANGCNFVFNSNITITPLDFKPDVTTLLDCQTSSTTAGNAVITLSDFKGSGDYSFTVLGPNSNTGSGDITLPATTWSGASEAGDYVFTITDDNVGCSIQKTVSVPETKFPNFTATTIDALCNGTNTGKIRVNAVQNGLTPLTYSILPSPAGMTFVNNVYGNLPAGTYTITVEGTNSCKETKTVIVGEPTPITGLNASVTQFVCSAGTNTNKIAKVIVDETSIGGGTGDYVYEFIYTNGNPSETITQRSTATEFIVNNTLGGNVEINVYDDNGCSPASTNVTIDPFVAFQEITATPTQPTCNGADGSVLVEAILVNSALGIDNDELLYHITSTDGSYTNSAILDASDATPLDHSFDNLEVGSYIITVTNQSTGCELKTTAVLTNPNTFDVEVTKIQDVECFGSETGIVDVNLIDDTYTVPFSWTIYNAQDDTIVKSGTDGNNTGINLYAGTYYVEITQINTPFCANTSYFSIKQSEKPLILNADISKRISCVELGEITVSASGGYGFYEFAMVPQGDIPTDADFSEETVFTDVTAGSYDVYVRDEKGCDEVFETLTLVQPTPILANAIQGDVIECEGEKSATISVINVSGGRPVIDPSLDYLFILNRLDQAGTIVSSGSPQTDAIFSDLPAGNYSVTVMDNYGCDTVTNPITITEPDEVSASLGLEKGNTCTTGAALELIASGGTGTDYEYSTSPNGPWTPFGTNTNDNTTLIDVPGPITVEQSFQFYVRDANLCISQTSNSVTISPIRPLEITPTVVADVSCYDEATGYIKVDVTGGLGDYLYTLFDVSGNVVVRPQQSGNTFSDLPAGVYFVEVESGDCIAQERIQIEEGEELTSKEPVIFNPICSDDLGSIELELQGGSGVYQYAISPNLDQFQNKNVFEDLEPGTYTIIAQDSKGCNPFVYKKEIVAPSPVAAKANILEKEFCAGDKTASFEINIEGGTPPYYTALNTQEDDKFIENKTMFDGLEGGETYVVFVKDANGCSTNVIVTLDKSVDLSPRAEMSQNCFDNSAVNEVTIMLAQDNLKDVIYTLDGGVDQFENRFSNLAPGKHTVTVSYFGCEKTVDFTVDPIVPLNLSVGESNINEFTILPTGGAAPYEYFIDGVSNGNDSKYVIRESGVYEVKVIDANGCEVVAQIDMEFIDIDVPNVFTPDGDNNNDTWTPKNTLLYPKIVTKIYDRYGRVVAELRVGDEWDGRYNGALLPTGDYWYVIKLNGAEDDREFVGHFTLYR